MRTRLRRRVRYPDNLQLPRERERRKNETTHHYSFLASPFLFFAAATLAQTSNTSAASPARHTIKMWHQLPELFLIPKAAWWRAHA